MGFRSQQIITILPKHIQRGRHYSITPLEQALTHHAPGAVSLLVPTTPTAPSMGINQLTIPVDTAIPWIKLSFVWIMKHRDLVNRPVNSAGFQAHDVGYALTLVTDNFPNIVNRIGYFLYGLSNNKFERNNVGLIIEE